eukprot:4433107-Amphidinium_carterae.1
MCHMPKRAYLHFQPVERIGEASHPGPPARRGEYRPGLAQVPADMHLPLMDDINMEILPYATLEECMFHYQADGLVLSSL